MARLKLSLKFDEWPSIDQQAFSAALDDNGDDIGLATFWSDDWRRSAVKRYGMWLHLAKRQGWLDEGISPLERMSEERFRYFVAELKSRVAPVTVFSYVTGVAEVLRVMAPDAKRPKFLRRALSRLARDAVPSRDERDKLVAPYQLYRAGRTRMAKHKVLAATDRESAMRFLDGLAMSMLVAKALRLKNFSGILLGKNISRNQLDTYEVHFAKKETKNYERIRAELPKSLTADLDYYLDVVRPFLLAGSTSDAMWITSKGSDMAPITLYYRFCRATQEELKKRINPHLVRKIVATGVAFATPGQVSITPVLLDHRNSRTEKEAYNLAGNLAHSAQRIQLLEPRRRRAIDGD